MNILLWGNDSTTHALAWKLINSTHVDALVLAPGNAGTTFFAPSIALDPTDAAGFTTFVIQEAVDLVIADAYAISAGVVDELAALSIPVLGSKRATGQLYTSRCAARDWLSQHHLPLPRGRVCTSRAQAEHYAATLNLPLAIISDDPGGPVRVCNERSYVPAAVAECFAGGGSGIIVEEYVAGPIVTAGVLTDGAEMVALPTVRLFGGTQPPDTAWDGAQIVTSPLWDRLESALEVQIRQPLLSGIRATTGFDGWISVTCVLAQRGPIVRGLQLAPGGLEASVVLSRLDSDLLPLLIGCVRGTLAAVDEPRWSRDAVVAVTLKKRSAVQDVAFAADTLAAFEPGVLLFQHRTIAAVPDAYAPRAGHYGTTHGAIDPSAFLTQPSIADASADLIAGVVVAKADTLETARHRLYTSLDRARLAHLTYHDGVGSRVL